jgi:tetratricopeptide (TPR) repeat protein
LALYDAFISYSHAKDKPIAAALQSVVQRLGKPWYKRRALRVFRDDTSLSATPQLWPSIEQALGQSRFLILLASPEAAASPWVGKEIAYWLEHKGADTLLIALTGGTLAWDETAADFGWSAATPLPAVLKRRFAAEPKWVDLAAYREGAAPGDDKFTELGADFAAAIRGIPKEDLLSQELREQRRALRGAWSAAAALLALAVLAGWQMQVALVQRERAENALTAATGTANTLVFELAQEFRDRTGMPVDLVRKILDRARDLQKQLTESGETSPSLRRSEAAAVAEMAITLRARGATKEGLQLADRCRAIMEALIAHDPGNSGLQLDLADCYVTLCDLQADAGRREEALATYRKALAIRERFIALDPTNAKWRFQLSISHQRIGNILLAMSGQREQALEVFRTALAISEKLAADDPGNTQVRQDLAVSYNKVGDMLAGAGLREQALAAYRKSLAVIEKLAADEPDNTLWKRHLATSWEYIGSALAAGGQRDDALAAYRSSLAIREKLVADDPNRAAWQREPRA